MHDFDPTREASVEADHPSSEKVAAYLDGSLTDEELSAFTGHLARCWKCRREVVEAGDLIYARRRRQRASWLVPASAAAAVAVITLAGPWSSPTPGGDLVRDAPGLADTAAVILARTPELGDTVQAGDLVFSWEAQPGAPLYRLSVTDAAGAEVWTADTRDTLLVLPPSISLPPGVRYYWYVDALDAVGRAISTGLRHFTSSP